MAEDSSPEKEEEKKAPEEEGEEETGEKKKGKVLKLAIIGVLVIAVLGGGGYFALGMFSSDEGGGDKANSAKEMQKKPTEPLPLYRMKTFIANLAGGRGRRYLKVTMAMELSSQETESEMKQKLPQLRDEVLTILSSRTFEDIKDADGKVKLRKEIAEKANRVMKTGKVRKVYFTEFVVQ